MEFVKSPIFYMGNKYDLLDTLFLYFPKKEEVDLFIDLFGGSGTVSANVDYDNIIYNELNHNVIELFKLFKKYNPDEITKHIKKRIVEFELYNETTDTRQIENNDIRDNANYKYLRFRNYYNKSNKDYLDLLTLTYFSFSNLIRFNSKSDFNMPFGNGHYIYEEHDIQIKLFCDLIKSKNIQIKNNDAFDILKKIKNNQGQFIYLDPPYSNTTAIYNEQRAFGGWTVETDKLLFNELDRLNSLGIKWALSNVMENKGIKNEHLEKWANDNNYKIIDIEEKTYASLGKGNAKSQEVLIINYKAPFERISIFDL